MGELAPLGTSVEKGGEGGLEGDLQTDSHTHSPICLSTSAASSGVARGMIPGSVKLVRNSDINTKKKRIAATTGIAGEMCFVKYGQLDGEREREEKKTKH